MISIKYLEMNKNFAIELIKGYSMPNQFPKSYSIAKY